MIGLLDVRRLFFLKCAVYAVVVPKINLSTTEQNYKHQLDIMYLSIIYERNR